MPQTWTALHYHLVFSTKHREPTITNDIQPRLCSYFGGLIRAEGGQLLAVGGMPDHIHLLARLNQRQALADVMRIVKSNSSKWIHETFPAALRFAWQTGYGAFTVGLSRLPTVKQYIANQEKHHESQSYQDEFRSFLIQHEIEFDERYLRD